MDNNHLNDALITATDNDQQPAVLSDRVRVDGIVTPLTLFADGKIEWPELRRCLVIEEEVVGIMKEGSKIRIKAVVDSGDAVSCCSGGTNGGLVRKDFVFEPLSEELQLVWCCKLDEFISGLGRPKRLFIFLNPYGGKKSASTIFANEVKPLLEDADIQYTLQETKHQLHAKEVVHTLDLTKYDGIACVSGDGTLVEVINGLLEREDWETAIKTPIGMVPAGTGNGMVKSLLHSVGEPCSATNAILAIIRGHKRPLDVATILQGQTRFFSVLMLAWGLVADIDIESEKYRWMGSLRLDFYALQRIIHLRKYSGYLSFVPAPGFESHGEPGVYTDICKSSEEDHAEAQIHGYRGPYVDLQNLEWRTIKGPFVSVWLHNVPWGAEDTMAAPDAEFADGYLDLIIIRDCPKSSLLSLMSQLSTGGHVKTPFVIYLKVKAFVLNPGPLTVDPSREGIIDSDGEVLARGRGTYKCHEKSLMAYDKIQITIDQGLATLFTPL